MEGRLGAGHTLEVNDLGVIPYEEAHARQLDLVAARGRGEVADTLLLLEHPPVITMGRNADPTEILASEATLSEAGATIERIERGGETTYHGPGQLVGYPIIDLRQWMRSLKRYVHLLEELFIRLLEREYGIAAGRDAEHRGVWVGEEKITAIGIAVHNRITYHGFAFNVDTDLSHFGWIIPCGITDRGTTSLARLIGEAPPMDLVKRQVEAEFRELFGYAASGGD